MPAAENYASQIRHDIGYVSRKMAIARLLFMFSNKLKIWRLTVCCMLAI